MNSLCVGSIPGMVFFFALSLKTYNASFCIFICACDIANLFRTFLILFSQKWHYDTLGIYNYICFLSSWIVSYIIIYAYYLTRFSHI